MNPAALETSPFRLGLHNDIPMQDYLALDALSASRLEWMAVSPLHYRYMLSEPQEATDTQEIGTALHMAVLEPDLFEKVYHMEPNPALIAPDNIKPRATKAYKDAVAALERSGYHVLRADAMAQVLAMRDSILDHPHAAAVLRRAPEREVSALWARDGRLCRCRFDALGDSVIGDIKTTRKLADFSPWTITRAGYYRRAGWYVGGARALGRQIDHFFFIAIENAAPYDVGVFALDKDTIDVGAQECDALVAKLERCEASDRWPGMFPDIQLARLTDAIALQMPGSEEDE